MSNHINIRCLTCSTEERQTRRHPAARRRGKQGDVLQHGRGKQELAQRANGDILQHGGEANKETSCPRGKQGHPQRRGKQGDILQHGGEANKETSPSKQI
ncbi:hypothetical protein CgunFtcFv8_004778 [Champsocephalus gunnari]|uniref:Uncharacterized protein n=1 Tax=Champsocephalus gunnari TaxID=52237 RepID=A0AAN8E1T4_CHAGU|nr:hypothetical protein CgunFtcFv8_004778 [Champsocephalus gunnari]